MTDDPLIFFRDKAAPNFVIASQGEEWARLDPLGKLIKFDFELCKQAASREDESSAIARFALALMSATKEACAALLDAEHEKRKHLDNHAAVYARMIRERATSA